MDTLALPINILDGFLGEMELHVVVLFYLIITITGLTAKLGHCYRQQLALPKAQKGEEENDDAAEGIRVTYAGRALSKWLTQLRNKYKSNRLPIKKVMQGKAVADQASTSVQ